MTEEVFFGGWNNDYMYTVVQYTNCEDYAMGDNCDSENTYHAWFYGDTTMSGW